MAEPIPDKQGSESAHLSACGLTPQLSIANPLAARAKPDHDVLHNEAIEIVEPQEAIRKIYDDADVLSNQHLLRDVRTVLSKG